MSEEQGKQGGEAVEVVATVCGSRVAWVQPAAGNVPDRTPLMTVAQHHRIVAAKDAEIARLQEHCKRLGQGDAERYWEGRYRDEAKECDELRAQLAAQQAAVPVAWVREQDLADKDDCLFASRYEFVKTGYSIPLYAAPAAPQHGDHSARSLEMVEVPIAPTRTMWEAAGNAVVELQHSGVGHHDKIAEAVWYAMLNAASVVKASSDSGEG